MSSTSKAWLVAASIGAVEALKDQGFCRWNYAMRLVQQHAKANLRSYTTQSKKLSSTMVSNKMREEKLKQSEESLRKVMTESGMRCKEGPHRSAKWVLQRGRAEGRRPNARATMSNSACYGADE
ncbi:hypothetical protein BUALT_Bualt03G0129700 [Buddleja alternifolia]|uniref:Wound-responsive family protein n=1 Tax=Buddleja alternifolia TaxID=168488 RepID=A0AAV6XUY2_9LAMI|nr:hypothetical protein BUALT_Bualt03G0129700 [Buddleja alternifolia]